MVSLGHLMSDLEQGLSYCTPEWSSGITGSPLAQSKGPESKISTAYCTGAISSGGQMSPPASPYCTVVQYVVENSFSDTLAEAGGQAVRYTSTADDIWRKEQPDIQPFLPDCLLHVLDRTKSSRIENTDDQAVFVPSISIQLCLPSHGSLLSRGLQHNHQILDVSPCRSSIAALGVYSFRLPLRLQLPLPLPTAPAP
jgi:hypothetical protein